MPTREQRRKSEVPKLHKLADKMTEILIYFIIIFSSWAFGTTEPWSIWTMNISAYALGILLLMKRITRLVTKYNPNPELEKNELSPKQNRLRLIQKTCTTLLACSMFVLLSYILTTAINAQASFNFHTNEYTYFEGVNKDLPHSYDARGTWFLFWQYLGLIILFWATHDWFAVAKTTKSIISINPRLKRLLLLLCFNGGALALECILQRIYFGENQGKLLFLIEPTITSGNMSQFGPFAYRSNAASYLNLIWPLSIGLLIQIGRENIEYKKNRIGNGLELLLIPCIILAASGPIISSTRGGSLVMIGLLIVVAVSLVLLKVRSKFLRFSVSLALLVGLGAAYYLGWEKIAPRFINIFSDNMNMRTQIYVITLKMINNYGIFGSGPGSFETVIQFELSEVMNQWHSWAHNDYLEFMLTFGKPGALIILLIMFLTIASIAINIRESNKKVLLWFSLISIMGLLTHALVDFPLQVMSIQVTICLICGSLIGSRYEYR